MADRKCRMWPKAKSGIEMMAISWKWRGKTVLLGFFLIDVKAQKNYNHKQLKLTVYNMKLLLVTFIKYFWNRLVEINSPEKSSSEKWKENKRIQKVFIAKHHWCRYLLTGLFILACLFGWWNGRTRAKILLFISYMKYISS